MFDRIEGLPSERLVRMLARCTAVICQCLGAKSITPEMLLRERGDKAKRQSVTAMKANARRAAAIHSANQDQPKRKKRNGNRR